MIPFLYSHDTVLYLHTKVSIMTFSRSWLVFLQESWNHLFEVMIPSLQGDNTTVSLQGQTTSLGPWCYPFKVVISKCCNTVMSSLFTVIRPSFQGIDTTFSRSWNHFCKVRTPPFQGHENTSARSWCHLVSVKSFYFHKITVLVQGCDDIILRLTVSPFESHHFMIIMWTITSKPLKSTFAHISRYIVSGTDCQILI